MTAETGEKTSLRTLNDIRRTDCHRGQRSSVKYERVIFEINAGKDCQDLLDVARSLNLRRGEKASPQLATRQVGLDKQDFHVIVPWNGRITEFMKEIKANNNYGANSSGHRNPQVCGLYG
jgi:hypothetical protein